jgi:ketosteroid isomerase-like protein
MRAFTVLAAILALAPPALAAPATVADEIRQLEHDSNEAYQANDLAKYFGYYADDFRGLFPEGFSTKADYVKSWTETVKSGHGIERFTYSDMQVQVSPGKDAAVASYHAVATTKNPGKPATDERFNETDVWFLRHGTWKLVEVHYADVGPGAQ